MAEREKTEKLLRKPLPLANIVEQTLVVEFESALGHGICRKVDLAIGLEDDKNWVSLQHTKCQTERGK